MRLILFCLLCLLIPDWGMSQSPAIRHFYDQFRSHEDATRISMGGGLLRLAATFSGEKEARKILRKVSHMRLLVIENRDPVSPEAYTQLIKGIQADRFEQLMQIREGGQHIDFYLREDGDTITDVLMLLREEGEFLMLNLEGKLKFSDLNDLHLDVDGAEQLVKLPENRPKT